MNLKQTFALHTLGCKLNFSESSSLSNQLKSNGFIQKNIEEIADIYIINTCSVTENADKECKQLIRKINTINDNAYIIITGCYAQLKPDEIIKLKGVDLVLGANEKFNLLFHIKNLNEKNYPKIYSCEIEEVEKFNSAYSINDRTRTFLKIQDGCDYSCSYCTIPLARGKSRSDSIDNILKNIDALSEKNIQEIVLTGVNIGEYFNDNKKFVDVINKIEQHESKINRFRISSIEPNLLTKEIIEIVAKSKKIMPHFHIPLQSGSDKILGLMRRRYKKKLYQEKIELINKLMPNAGIGVDVIVGFPDENETNFKETFNFIHNLNISYLHVFTYSERENTEALKINNSVALEKRKERNKILKNLSFKKSEYFKNQFVGTKRNVLFESKQENNLIQGYTDNYIKVQTFYKQELENKIINWNIT